MRSFHESKEENPVEKILCNIFPSDGYKTNLDWGLLNNK